MMPRMPDNLGSGSRKIAAKRSRTESDARRESAAKRGYGHAWQRTRKHILRRDPVCVIAGCNEAATEVDHIVPKRMGGLDTPENLQGLCKHHHSIKTANESAFKPGYSFRRVVVCGPPASGKTTWVSDNAEPGDLVFDWDALATCLFGRRPWQSTKSDGFVLSMLRDQLISYLQLNAGNSNVFIIISDYENAGVVARRLSGSVQVMDATHDECINRVEADAERSPVLKEHIKAINAWFGQYLSLIHISEPTRPY